MVHIQKSNFVADQLKRDRKALPTRALAATLLIGQFVMWLGIAGFFASMVFSLLSLEQVPLSRQFEAMQSRSKVVVVFWALGAAGIVLTAIPALLLGVNLRRGGYKQVLEILKGRQGFSKLEAGLEGERQVAELLAATLDDQWTLISGVVPKGLPGDIDHVLVGPAGVFAIEVKHWAGRIYYDHVSNLWQRSNARESTPERVKDPTYLVKMGAQILSRALGVKVTPLVLFTHEDVHFYGSEQPSVKVLCLPDFLPWLETKPAMLSNHQVQEIITKIHAIT